MQGKAAKPANLDPLSLRERVAHKVQQVLDGELHILCRQVLLLARDNFYKFRFGHLSLRLLVLGP